MTNNPIIEDYKADIFHPGFGVFYCKELYKHAVRGLHLHNVEKDLVLSAFKNTKFAQIVTQSRSN
jgi:hypothetical protein